MESNIQLAETKIASCQMEKNVQLAEIEISSYQLIHCCSQWKNNETRYREATGSEEWRKRISITSMILFTRTEKTMVPFTVQSNFDTVNIR